MKKPDTREAAVALAYRAGQSAPQVVAKGHGLVAETIIMKAQAHGIYVHESAELVSLLMQVDLDQHIPPQLYRAVAELLAWLYKLEAGVGLPLPAVPYLSSESGAVSQSNSGTGGLALLTHAGDVGGSGGDGYK